MFYFSWLLISQSFFLNCEFQSYIPYHARSRIDISGGTEVTLGVFSKFERCSQSRRCVFAPFRSWCPVSLETLYIIQPGLLSFTLSRSFPSFPCSFLRRERFLVDSTSNPLQQFCVRLCRWLCGYNAQYTVSLSFPCHAFSLEGGCVRGGSGGGDVDLPYEDFGTPFFPVSSFMFSFADTVNI